jgi:uroporphyrinogen-III synthase
MYTVRAGTRWLWQNWRSGWSIRLLGLCSSPAGPGRVTRLPRIYAAAEPVRRFPAEAASCLESGELHAVLFLSAETAAVFVRLLPPEFRHALASVAALTIGKPAAGLLETLPWLRVCRAENPTLDDVLALI